MTKEFRISVGIPERLGDACIGLEIEGEARRVLELADARAYAEALSPGELRASLIGALAHYGVKVDEPSGTP